jgi:shikimate 5-dehydrogenase
VSTLPWTPAKSLLPSIFPQEFPLLLECAFPRTLEFSVGGERMLVHQAVLQVKLMTKHLNLDFQAEKIAEAMTSALEKGSDA